MNTPLEVAVTISVLVAEARTSQATIDILHSADELFTRFPQSGYSPRQIAEALCEEACAAGVKIH